VSGTAGLSGNNTAASKGSVGNLLGNGVSVQTVASVENVSNAAQDTTIGGATGGVQVSTLASTSALSGQIIFQDNFSTNGPIDSTKWHYPTGDASFFGRVQQRQELPKASDGVMHLNLDTYNPTDPHDPHTSLLGTSAISGSAETPQFFNPSTMGPLAFSVEARYEPNQDGTIQRGIIGGWLYLYSDNGNPDTHDEIDIEGMSNFPNQIRTNIYHNEPPGNGTFKDYPLAGDSTLATFHTYTIEWFKDMVVWLVDGVVVRTVTDHDPGRDLVPTQDMALHSTIWAGGPEWDTGDPSLKAASTAGGDQTFTIDVKNVKVEKITSQLETAADDTPAANNPLNTVQNEYLYGTGNDQIFAGGGNNTIDGGPGVNVAVFSGAAGNFEISATAGEQTLLVTDKSGAQGTDEVINCQTLEFSDRTVDASSVVQAANLDAQTFIPIIDLYAAYLHRAPDALGLDYWASALSNGVSLADIAKSFSASAEAVANQVQGQSLSEIVSSAYTDILHRAPDAGGLNFWIGQLQSGLKLENFALSFIMAAKASNAADAQTVAAEETIGGQYAIEQGLNDVGHAKAVLAALGPSGAEAASDLINGYAAAAALPNSSELVVKLLGIHIGQFA
jgi:hypothetical protein